MGNALKMEKKQQIQALIGLGWGNRTIHREPGIGQNPPKVPTDYCAQEIQNPPEVPADLPPAAPTNSKSIHPYTGLIKSFYLRHLTAQRMYQDLVEEHGYTGSYDIRRRKAMNWIISIFSPTSSPMNTRAGKAIF